MNNLNRETTFEIPFSRLMSNPDYANASFYSFIIAKMAVKVTKDVPTAGVSWDERKYNLFINPDFFETLDIDEKIAVLIHEALHVMLKHNFRQGERDQKLFNTAADIALNQLIHKPAKLPEGAMLPETFDFKEGLTAEGYYELLKEEKDKQEQEKQEQEDKGEEWGGPSDGKPDLTGDEEMTIDSHEGWGQAGDPAEEELARATMEKMIKDAMDKSRGNLPSNISELLDLWTKKAKISWKRVLKKIVSSKKGSKVQTIKRRDRRQPQRKDIKGKKVFYDQPNVIVGVDVSGSMSDEEIFNGLSEIAEVCKVTHSNLQVVQIDTNIQGTEEFDPKQKTWTREGCGGTDMSEMARFLINKKIPHDVLIMISDMYIEDVGSHPDWLKMKTPVIWLNTSGTDVSWDGMKGHKVFNISDA